ncbi:hypothetical protein M409DRAFT_52123 [Zasmidium cellare ATCC 36951]|uniref:Uncharacterized protein n=1 Tax=Zasmidium cellare ATCC 36951 TaxID=1080233 RepID=A0A6A6CUT7_ZASCE|nr:uncharacterized protein M409DRAFT_52123 [Zasmidium cellare ATCC 36951]KAF2169592.1 hypothetical protein M409DRAFT_52123 [Zasmidium cellare ATCC 36951]
MAYRNSRWPNTYVKAGQSNSKGDQYGNITTDEIRLDLTHINHDGNRPQWPLSSYAPGRNPPRQLIEGPLEISPEEMRVQCYLARANGKGDEYISQENQLISQSQQQAQTILSGLEAARNYVIDGQNHHPNRTDMEIKPTQNFPWVNKPGLSQISQSQSQTGGFGQTSAFGGGGTNTTSAFGQPSSLSTPKLAFGAPTPAASSPFGGAQKPAAFGQASQPGQSLQPAFGQSDFGSAAKPAFGAPSQPGAFGQPAQTSSPFGQPSQPSQTTSTFGQPSQATPPTQPSAFGGGQTGGSAFGQPSAFGAAKPSPFAQAAQNAPPQSGGSAFGASKPSPFATATQPTTSSPFAIANKPTTSSPFGTASNQPATSSSFGAPSKPTTSSPFGAPSQPTGPSTGFGAASNPTGDFGTSSNTTGGFGTTTNNTGGFGTAAAQPSGQKSIPQTWKGHRVLQEGNNLTYYLVPAPTPKDPSATKKIRIWFPTGAPEAKDASYAEAASPDVYEGQLGETLKSLYEFVAMNATFKDGIMPEVPPKREWITWDF